MLHFILLYANVFFNFFMAKIFLDFMAKDINGTKFCSKTTKSRARGKAIANRTLPTVRIRVLVPTVLLIKYIQIIYKYNKEKYVIKYLFSARIGF